MKVLVAVDMVDGSEIVLKAAARLVNATDGSVIAVHVITHAEQERRQTLPGESRYLDVMLGETEHDLARSLSAQGVDSSFITSLALTGEPAAEVQRLALEHDADVIVIGMRRRTRVGKFLLGSDVQEMLMASDRPVLVVPTDESG